MKNEELFIGLIYQITGIKHENEKRIEKISLLEPALLQYNGYIYQNLKNKEQYNNRGYNIGDKFVYEGDNKENILSINSILPKKEQGKNLTKRKALKRFNTFKKFYSEE